jgi:hypothetical protein
MKILSMDSNQTTVNPAPAYVPQSRGLFGTGIPGTIAFLVGILLFFMPFVDIKCNNMSLQTVTGVQLATGFKMKNSSSNNPFMDDVKSEDTDKAITKTTTKSDNKEPNLYALVALGLGALGLILSFIKAKGAMMGAMVTGVLSAGALIGMMIDIKKKIKMPDLGGTKTSSNDLDKGLDEFGKEVSDKINISVDFTAWFYIAVIAFLLAAFFCYKRMRSVNTV